MTTRQEHIRAINANRSSKVVGMIEFLRELEKGEGGDYDGFYSFGITNSKKLRGELNSYRAMKICKLVNKTISKKYLLEFIKDKDYEYQLTSKEFNSFIKLNKVGLKNYHYFNDGCHWSITHS